MSEELKIDPCPFCGYKKLRIARPLVSFFSYCPACDARGPMQKTREDAVVAHNTRTASAQLAKAEAKHKKLHMEVTGKEAGPVDTCSECGCLLYATLGTCNECDLKAQLKAVEAERDKLRAGSLPNPLQIELKDGSVSVSMFKDDDGAGVLFKMLSSPHKVGSRIKPEDAGYMPPNELHAPQKGEVYIKCSNIDSFNVLKDCIKEVEQALNPEQN